MVAAPPTVNGQLKDAHKEEENLWSSILDSASDGKRAVPNKRVVLLGEPRTGKSTLLSHISTPSSTSQLNATNSGDPGPSKGFGINSIEPGKAAPLDLGLSYGYVDVGDEGDEDTLALLSFYSLPSPNLPYTALLPLALPPTAVTLLDSLVVIALDWEKPWSFLETLKRWLAILESVLEKAQGWEQDEGKERVERTWRAYNETGTTSVSSATISGNVDDVIPLPKGTLSNNLGIDIVVVCTKADQMDQLEREKDFKEEQFDYIQQSLRTICLTYGAALFFTSHSRPESFVRLRSYILHRLFTSRTSLHTTVAMGMNGNGSTINGAPTAATVSRTFPFPYKPDVVNRDQVVVPSGWDSSGKIKVIKDGFDTDALRKGWVVDLEEERRKVKGEKDQDWNGEVKATRMYEDVVPDLEADDQPIKFSSRSAHNVKDEQDFLKEYYDALQKDREKDPRAAFQKAGSTNVNRHEHELRQASIVGPMASTNLNLPTMERLSERESRPSRKDQISSTSNRTPLSSSSSFHPSIPAPLSSSTARPSLSSSSLLSPSTPNDPVKTEVIANFFQDLLKRKLPDQGAGRGLSSLGSSLSPTPTERSLPGQNNGRSPPSRSPPPPNGA